MFGYNRFLVGIAACLLQVLMVCAQEKKHTFFTVEDGLPSNYIYRLAEDNRGFLWVPTNAGVARFDGKYFQVFTTKDGLPDNEVFGILKEKDGRIWAECYNQVPAYFDEKQNRFVVPYLKKELAASMLNTLGASLQALPDGGVIYSNRNRSIVFKNGKYQKYDPLIDNSVDGPLHKRIFKEFPDGSMLTISGIPQPLAGYYQAKLYHIKGHHIIDSATLTQRLLPKPASTRGGASLYEGDIYGGFRSINKFYQYSDIRVNPIRWKTDSLITPEPYINYFSTHNRLALVAESGKIYLYDRKNLKPLRTINNDYMLNAYFNDSKGNEWVSTIDKGLILTRNSALIPLPIPQKFRHLSFMSITPMSNGTLLAGNYNGEVFVFNAGKIQVRKVVDKSPARIRKIIVAGGNIYTISEEGIYSNFKTKLFEPTSTNMSFGKTAVQCNDTTILIATQRNLIGLNTKTSRLFTLNPYMLRVTTLAKAGNDNIYMGSVRGLYKYNFKTNGNYISLSDNNPELAKRVSGIYYASDGLLWVLQADNTILALKNDTIVSRIYPDNVLSNSTNKYITGGKPGQLWISTTNGIKVMSYRYKGNKISYSIRNISMKDGLAGNEVEEISYQDGKMYVATNNGISIVPEDYIAPKPAIPTYLVEMSINQHDTVLASHYQLNYNQRNVQMRFAGMDLKGYFGFFQYKLDDDVSWTRLQGNTLNIQLRAGKHTLEVRAVDVNGHRSDKVLSLRFDVATPFWLNVWFWLITAVIIQLVLIYLISRRQKRRKEARLAKRIAAVQTAALEQQAFTSLMNPHFMFNALNSIQYYINMQDRQNANRYLSDFASLIRKNFEAAQESFITLEEEVENIKLYLNLEQMRFNGKFEYKITIDKALDVEDWMIPTMILQPLLENALLHGVMPSAVPGKLSVLFARKQENLLINIIDNGIGLVNSRGLKANNNHKSSGMELILKRIKALGNFDTPPITIGMEPAYKSKTNPGNKVMLIIPAALYTAWQKAKNYV